MNFSDFVSFDSRTWVVMQSFSLTQRIHISFYMYGFRKKQFRFQLSYVTTTQSACTVWESLKRYAICNWGV
jgi:hypothetical protein